MAGKADMPYYSRLQRFYDEFMKNSGSLEYLQTLFRLLNSDRERSLPKDVSVALVSTLSDDTIPVAVACLCGHILHENLPDDDVQLQDLQGGALRFSPTLLEMSLACHQNELPTFWHKLIGQVSQQDVKPEVKLRALRVLTQLIQSVRSMPKEIKIDESDTVATALKTLLVPDKKSLHKPTSATFQRQSASSGTLELDGIPTSDFFTVLNIPDMVNDDVLLGVQSFSALNQLWESLFGTGECFSTNPKMELLNKTVDYCLRILDQGERVALKSVDSNVQRAATIEAIHLLDNACSFSHSLIIRVFPVVRRVHNKATNLEVSLPCLQFLLHHGQSVGYDPLAALDRFFEDEILLAIQNPCSACEVIIFLKRNLEKSMSMASRPFLKFFPNLLKLCAWYPLSILSDICDLLPSFLSPDTAAEVLRCILDLPRTAAALIYEMEESAKTKAQQPSALASAIKFLLRKRSGIEPPTDMEVLRKYLVDFQEHPRVVEASGAVIPLLETYFDVVFVHFDSAVAAYILKTILEQSTIGFAMPGKDEEIQKIFAQKIVGVFQKCPCLVINNMQEITEYLIREKHPSRELCTNLIWIVGQYVSSAVIGSCTLEIIRDYYDTLEVLSYEYLHRSTPSTLCIILATLVKLASRNQDLMQRVLLVINKVHLYAKARDGSDWKSVTVRCEEYKALFEEPNVSLSALSPPPSSLTGLLHRDVAVPPMLWRAASSLDT